VDFLKEEKMFRFVETVDKSAFFVRRAAPLFDPFLDGLWLQGYNKKRFPIDDETPRAAAVKPAKLTLEKVQREVRRLLTTTRQFL
jgi:hypothetical protein